MDAALTVLDVLSGILDGLGVPYLVGGSIASSVHGVPRTTQDIDVVADVRTEQVDPLAAALGTDFYVDAEMIRDAIAHQGTFNLLHLASMHKVDVFIMKPALWWIAEMERRRPARIEAGNLALDVPVASAEDMVLQKLDRYREGQETSGRQWTDVLGVLRVQQTTLDLDYLRRWAATLDLSALLERALEESRHPWSMDP